MATTEATDFAAEAKRLELARDQGAAYRRALEHMVQDVAFDGGMHPADEYLVAYAVQAAEGMYGWVDGELAWREPDGEDLHLQVAVCDSSDGRFLPGLEVTATLIASDGEEVDTHEMPLVWHPMLYHYGCDWTVPADGEYTLRVRVDPASFMRHDRLQGDRFNEPVETTFTGVTVRRSSQ